MRILLVTGIMNVPIVEGTQKSVLNLANGLVERGHEVAWLTDEFPGRPEDLNKEVELIEEDIRPFNWLSLRKASKSFDVVNVHTSSPRMGFFWRTVTPRKSIVTWAAWKDWDRREKMMQKLCNSSAVTEAVREKACGVNEVTSYSVDTETYRDKGKDDDRPCLMYIGKPSARRGFDHVCEVLSRIESDFVFRYAVADARGDKEEAEDKLEEYGLSEQTELFSGFVADLPQYLSQADIFMNLVENTERITSPPILTLEAMACETVSFSSSDKDFTDLINDGENGFTFDFDDYDEMAEKAEALIQDKQRMKEIGVKGREVVKENHSIEKSVDSFEELYRKSR